MATDTMSQIVVKDLHGASAPQAIQPPLTKPSTSEKKLNKVQSIKSEEHIVRRPFSPKSEKYIRKLDRLVKIYEKMSEKNDRLRYHIVKVKEEVNKLSHIKRHLCCRLSSFNDNYMDENLEIPDTNNRDANFEKLIGEVITNVEPVGPPASKKRKVETKKVVVQKPKEVKEDSEEPEAREAINRILNDAKSLMRQQQQEQEEMVKSRIQDQKRQQQTQQIRQQRNSEKQTKVNESKSANNSGSQSAPVIPHTQQLPSTSCIPSTNAPSSQTLNQTNPTTQASKSSTNQQQKPTVNPPSSDPKYTKTICSTTSSNNQESKPIIKNSLPLPQAPGVYILAPGQQLIKQPSHVQVEMIAKNMTQKQEEKNNLNLASFSATSASITPQKSSSQSYVVTHHDLPKNTQIKNDIHRQHSNHLQSHPSSDNQKLNASQSQIFVRRFHPTENQSPAKVQHQQHSTQSQQKQGPQIQIVTQAPKGPPLQAQISSQPLPNGSQLTINNQSQIIRLRQNEGNQTSDNLQPQQPHPIQMEQVKLFYTQRQLQDPSTINPQLLPHRQLNAQRLHMEQQMKEREKQKKLEEEKTKDSLNLHQNQQQAQMQPIVIQSSNVQQIHQLQSQPRLREALQNAGNDTKQKVQLVQTIPSSAINTPVSQRIITTKQSPAKSVLQPKQNLPQQQQQPQPNNVYFIDSSRCIRLASRDQLVGVQPFTVTGNQAIRYYLPQNISTQAITVTSSPQKQQQQSKFDDGKFDRLLRASSIDHLLPDNPDHDSKNDDNIDWSIYEEPKPSKSTPRKALTPRKRGAAIKVDSNSDAMARISPILAKFQQEMAQSTVAQEQQHQQELTMAARNATKQPPVRTRKRPTKAEKEAAVAAKASQNNQTPGPTSSNTPSKFSSQSSNNLQVPNTIDNAVDSVKNPPSIVVTAATPDSSQASKQKPTTVDIANVQIQQISQNIRSQ